ncbi:hypothetical protein F511_19927 [Dorcoceras hygrometricum]|uniref:Uncharacterized protein n=1 Tax=Dorcoceras hygrometricum TaxID=472368 RepID=A0A2Z7DGP5_9LAMI|nr:hypothetical protein F511_19927 [Dorcoceras hygrometricum]
MSLFDLQDVSTAIGSIATLDLPMVIDLIGIYGLKGPYCPECDSGATMVVGPRLAVSLNHLGSHKYWIRDSRTDTQLNMFSARREFGECDFLKVNRGQTGVSRC